MARSAGAAARLPESDRWGLANQALAGSETVSDLAARNRVKDFETSGSRSAVPPVVSESNEYKIASRSEPIAPIVKYAAAQTIASTPCRTAITWLSSLGREVHQTGVDGAITSRVLSRYFLLLNSKRDDPVVGHRDGALDPDR
jgi:hypothetical protein